MAVVKFCCQRPGRVGDRMAGGTVVPQELADVVFSEALEEYQDLELAWLQQLYEMHSTAAAKTAPNTMSLQLVNQFFCWNREACCFPSSPLPSPTPSSLPHPPVNHFGK